MTPASKRDIYRDRLVAHVLEHGLRGASLRPLAAAAGTSDRMLIYHFGSKDALLADILDAVAERMKAGLEILHPEGERVELAALLDTLAAPGFLPFFRLWQDLVGGAAHEEWKFAETARRIIDDMHVWLASRLGDDDQAALALAAIDGMAQMRLVGSDAKAEAATRALLSLAASGR